MDKEAFRERFKAYKEGKPVSEIYDAGLPKYAGGTPSYDNTMQFLKQYEGFKDTAYLDGNGVPTIGYGFTDTALVSKGKISKAEADARLRQEVASREKFLSKMKNWDKLSEDSKTALRSYYYNYPAGFKPSTKFMLAWNAGNYSEAIRQVDAGMNDKKNPGLRTRRLKELAMLKADPFLMPQLNVPVQEHMEVPVSTAVRQTIPQELNIYGYDPIFKDHRKPMLKKLLLLPALNLPNLVDFIEDSLWLPLFNFNTLPQNKCGKLPNYGDGKRYLYDEDTKSWDRITDNDIARAFADITITPKGSKQDIRTNPIYHDKRVKNAGYVTREMLEDEANSRKQRETAIYAPGLEQVSPEFDLLLLGSGLRSNPLTQQLWKNRKIAKEIDKVVNEGIVGATREMPLVKPQDLYNPEHFRSTVNRNAKLLGYSNSVAQHTKPRNINLPKRLNSQEPHNIVEEVPESVYNGPTPKTSVDRKNLYLYKDKILEIPHLDRGLSLPKNEISEYVDSDGNVNMRNVVKAIRRFYKDNPNARNYEDIINSSGNLYQHIKDVVKSAQQAPIPKGSTRQELVQAALFHDIGKVIDSSSSHAFASTDILDNMGIHVSPAVRHAIRRHMGHHLGDEDPLTRALHFVDVVRNTEPMSNVGAFDTYRNLLYPAKDPYKIKQQYSWDTDYQLSLIINPILREYGYDEIPLGLSKEEARKQVLDRAQQHRRFVRGQHDFNERNLENARQQFIRREGREPTREELFDLGFEYLKEHNTSSGDRGMDEYLNKFELPRKKYMSLYTSNSDEVPNSYIRNTNDDFAIRAIEMPVLDNPDWSLAELWGYNDYPLVYSGGGGTPTWNSDWRYDILPAMLNNDISSGAITKQMADRINASNIYLAHQRSINDAKQIVTEGIKNKDLQYSDFPQYKDIKPSVFILAFAQPRLISSEAPFPPLGEHASQSQKMLFIPPNIGEFIGLSTRGYDREFGYNPVGILDYINEINNFITKYGGKEIMPHMYSKLPDTENGMPTTIIKYPRALHDLHGRILRLKSEEPIPARIPIKLDIYGKPYVAFNYRNMSVKQAIAHNNANKIRFTKDGYPVNTPILINDYGMHSDIWDFAPTNTKYIPSMQKLVKDAVNQYFKDIKMAKSKDAFVRRKLLEEELERYINNKINIIKDLLYLKPELIVPTSMSENSDYPFTTESFDGYRVFVTEHDYGPGSKYQNNYIIVGPRGSKLLRINRDFKFDVDNHGYVRGHDNVGRPAKGLTKNAK